VRDPGLAEAEIAFAVVDEWQGKGVGRALLRELSALARREGIERFRANVVAGNDAALALVRGVGTVVSFRLEDGAFEVVVALPQDVQPFQHANRRRLQEGAPHRGAEGRRDEADR
jgi:GNAT superfamily N-acetyltransferase